MAQPMEGWNWIQPNQTYVRMEVWTDGIYRTSAAQLGAGGYMGGAGINEVKVYYRGIEQAIHVEDLNGNTIFDGTDFIEFPGFRNDGGDDGTMYKNPTTGQYDATQQPNPYSSLFSDTAVYYFTWSPAQGKRQIPFFLNNYSAYTPELWFPSYSHLDLHLSNWVGGSAGALGSENSEFTTGEGYLDLFPVQFGNPRTHVVPYPGAFLSSGRNWNLQVRLFSYSIFDHSVNFQFGNFASHQDYFQGVRLSTISFSGGMNTLTGSQANLTTQALNAAGDNHYLSWIRLFYDRGFSLSGHDSARITTWNKVVNSYWKFTQTNATNGQEAIAYDLTLGYRITGTCSNGQMELIVPGSNQAREFYVSHTGKIRTPVIRPSIIRHLNAVTGARYIIITDRSLATSAQQLASFRENSSRSPQSCIVVFTDEIYEEFGFGMTTPLAIRRFIHTARKHWTIKPAFVMLWGKGMHETIRRNTREAFLENKVPTFGFPASDMLHATSLDTGNLGLLPSVNIGRVNIFTDTEGLDYISKLQQYEQSPWDGTWMKEAVHLGGGENAGEQNLIHGYLDGRYKPVWTSAPWGGRVTSQQKSNGALPSVSGTEIQNRINQGVGLISFFGHSTNNIFDIDLRDANEYNNTGKYPLVIANGCYGGNFSTTVKTFGERFMLERNKGSIAWVASSGLGYIVYLGELTKHFYETLYRDSLGVPIGQAMRQAQQRFFSFGCNSATTCPITLNHLRQTNLQGDPALILQYPQNADYEITEQGVRFHPDPFTAQDSFSMFVAVRNLGKAQADSIPLTIHRQILSGPLQGDNRNLGTRLYQPVSYLDTLIFPVPFQDIRDAGLNRFSIWLDSSRLLNDFSYLNNQLAVNRIVPGNAPAILYPYDFAIVPEAQIKLSASAYVMSIQSGIRYEFGIDTSYLFDSPFYQSSGTINGSSCYMEWALPFSLQPGQVYYWRVRLLDETQAAWATASFRHIPLKTGWTQAQIPQYAENTFHNLSVQPVLKSWKFDSLRASINIITNTGGNARFNFNGIKVSNNDNHPLVSNGVWFSHIGGENLSIQTNHPQYGGWTWYPMPASISALTQAIQQVPTGEWVVLCSQVNPGISSWTSDPGGNALYQAIEGLGSASIRTIPDNQPYILAGRKGSLPGQAMEVLQSPWQLSGDLSLGNSRGAVTSRQIGPVKNWSNTSLQWVGDGIADSVTFSAFTSGQNGQDSAIFSTVAGNQISVNLQNLPANLYPTLKLEAELKDILNRTPAYLENWEVTFQPAGDAIADASRFFSLSPAPVAEGKVVTVKLQVSNYTSVGLDSIEVRYRVLREGAPPMDAGTRRFAPLPPNQSILTEHQFTTSGLSGLNTLVMEVNPDQKQVEQYQFNNFFYHPFRVDGDNVNPLLDITFDGRRVMDGEIVSPKPEIVIISKDDNPVYALDSLGCFRVSYRTNSGADSLVNLINNPEISFSAGILPQNRARLRYQPGPLQDGEYTLRIQGYDKVGNSAGEKPYEIRFKVINENTITPIFNYPNPFSTKTRFVFTLTGKDMPSTFRIDIYTITGRLVRRLDLKDLGLVYIGQNLNGFEWDGTDDYGDRLANGVYLYKATIRYPDGSGPKIREENGNANYFKNGFGKLVLFR